MTSLAAPAARRPAAGAGALRALALALVAALPCRVRAQRVLGPGEDASLPPAGVVRVGIRTDWAHFDEQHTPGGTIEPLAAALNVDSLGVRQIPALAPLQSSIRALAGVPAFTLSLGQLRVSSNATVITVPISAELGVANRFSIGVSVPIVRARSNVFANLNPTAAGATVGPNPAGNAWATNAGIVGQLRSSAQTLRGRLTSCETTPDPSCASILADTAAVVSFIGQTREVATGVADVYGTGSDARGAAFVPIAGSAVQQAIDARIAAIAGTYESRYGIATPISGSLGAAAGPAGLPTLQTLLPDPAYGIVADTLGTVEHIHLGDIEVGAKAMLVNTLPRDQRLRPTGFRYRSLIAGVYRIGTGTPDYPDVLLDVPVETGASAVGVRSLTDLFFGPHAWATFIARYTVPMADTRRMRIPTSRGQVILPQYTLRTVNRQLGAELSLELEPRWVLNDYLSFGGYYLYRHKRRDRYTGTFAVDSATTGVGPVTLDASMLDYGTEQVEHRLGVGFTYSTVAAAERGKAWLPIEVSLLHAQTVRGVAGYVPQLSVDQLRVRAYLRVFGR